MGRAAADAGPAGFEARNILILSPRASIFGAAGAASPAPRRATTVLGFPMPQASPWWMPDVHADRQPFLQARRRILAGLRSHLEARDFVEVETAILQRSPGNEAHLHAFATELVAPDRTRMALHLHTSPEFACKKLLAAGERRIFEFARVFRNRERGALHHPEFTMLEWYRVGRALRGLDGGLRRLSRRRGDRRRSHAIHFPRPQRRPVRGTPERLTVAEAFARHAGIDLPGDASRRRARPGGARRPGPQRPE